MARNGKIDASGPSKAINFLKKNKQTLAVDARLGRSVERDIIDFNIAKKACEKANIEGRVSGIDDAISILHMMTEQGLNSKMIMQALQVLKDNTLGKMP